MEDNRDEMLKRLDEIWSGDYDLDPHDTIVASLVKYYLITNSVEGARRVMSWLVKPKTTMEVVPDSVTVIQREDGLGTQQPSTIFLMLPKTQVDIDCNNLAKVVDLAAGLMEDEMTERIEDNPPVDEGIELTNLMMKGLKEFDGNTAVRNCSVELFDYLYDCYQAVMGK